MMHTLIAGVLRSPVKLLVEVVSSALGSPSRLVKATGRTAR